MNIKTGIDRKTSINISLDDRIAQDNVVRLIDAFVNKLDLEALEFSKIKPKKEGCPMYHAKDMLKLCYYGYFNRIRSCRKLEAECVRNIEVWWLINYLEPKYHTIADFRKDNPKALKKTYKMFVSFLKDQGVFGGDLLVQDGTKIRAQNNKRNNYNEEKLQKHFKHIEGKDEQHIKELEQLDAVEDMEDAAKETCKKQIEEKQQTQQQRKQKYEGLQEELKASGEAQISTVDSDSRSFPIKDRVTDVCFNVQAVVDSKHHLVVEFDTINTTDQGQLCGMATKAMETLGVKETTLLADAGYNVGKDLQDCKDQGITTLVAPVNRNKADIDPAYQTSEFTYDKEKDCYTCPQGAILSSNGKEYEKKKKGRATYQVKKYVTDQCLKCIAKVFCTKAQRREIERSEYQDVIDENNKRVHENPGLYKLRQQIIEHIFGTIKRSWGYTYTLLKGMEKVNGEMAIIFTMYNMRRSVSIYGVKELISRLESWKPEYKAQKTALLRHIEPYKTYRQLIAG
jgi:transposase